MYKLICVTVHEFYVYYIYSNLFLMICVYMYINSRGAKTNPFLIERGTPGVQEVSIFTYSPFVCLVVTCSKCPLMKQHSEYRNYAMRLIVGSCRKPWSLPGLNENNNIVQSFNLSVPSTNLMLYTTAKKMSA